MLRGLARASALGARLASRSAPRVVAAAPAAKFSSVMDREIDAISGLTEEQQQVRPSVTHLSSSVFLVISCSLTRSLVPITNANPGGTPFYYF